VTNVYSPAVWFEDNKPAAETAGVWLRRLRSEAEGDGIVLCYLEPGAGHASDSDRPTNLLVLAGAVAIGAGLVAQTVQTGTYTPVGSQAIRARADGPALGLLLSGPGLGTEPRILGSPRHWLRTGAGMLSMLLSDFPVEGDLAERVAGFAHIEVGSSVAPHPHQTAHIFLFLEGEADDEIIFPDGHRDIAHRRRGDFVVYPFPVQHQLFSPTGCSIFFVHEPVRYSRAS
jgi:hypothetical protein